LPGFDPDAGQFLAQTLTERGVKLISGQMASRIDQTDAGVTVVLEDGSRHEAAMAFLAIGRKPDMANLNLAAAEVALEKGVVVVDGYGRSSQSNIYFAGDVTGDPMIANRAMAQARVAGQHAAGKTPDAFTPETVISAIYTEPQVAQVGQLTGDGIQTKTTPYSAGAKAHLLPEGDGFIKLAFAESGDDGQNRLLGAVAVGPHAADVLAPLAVAIQAGMSVQALSNLYGAHPTMSELAFIAARQAA
jgi:dihydrolipoamide dehydrogenase